MKPSDLRALSSEEFEWLCHRLLRGEYGDEYQPFDGEGLDGKVESRRLGFQCYHPPSGRFGWGKIDSDLRKASTHGWLRAWVLLTSAEFKSPRRQDAWRRRTTNRAFRCEVYDALSVCELAHRHSPATADIGPLLEEADQCIDRGDTRHAAELASRAVAEALVAGSEAQRCKALVLLVWARLQEGDLEEASATALQAHGVAASAPESPGLRATAERALAETYLRRGQLPEAVEHSRLALSVSEAVGSARGTGLAHHQLAWVALAYDEVQQAREHADACRDVVMAEDEWGPAAWEELDGHILLREGRVDEGAALIGRAASSFAHAGNHRVACVMRFRQAMAFARIGKLPEALEACQAASEMPPAFLADPCAIDLHLLKARLLRRTGQDEAGLAVSDSVRERAKTAGLPRHVGEAAMLSGEICARLGEYDAALDSSRVAYRAFSEASVVAGQAEALRLRAAVHHLTGRVSDAERILKRVLALGAHGRLSALVNARTQVDLAAVLRDMGRYDDALGALPPHAGDGEGEPDSLTVAVRALRREIETANRFRARLAEVLRTEDPLRAARTEGSANLNEAHREVLRPLLEWTSAWKATPDFVDFWGKGNFTRLALNHAHYKQRAFHVTVEVSSVPEARRAVRCLSPLTDCLTLLWKGRLDPGVTMCPMHLDYDGPGGWGYSACVGSEMRPRDDAEWDWCPALGVGNFLPVEVCDFWLAEARRLAEDGRLLVVPAPLVGCVSRSHGPLERLFSRLVCAEPILRSTEDAEAGALSLAMPYFPEAPIADLSQIIIDEQDSLRQMRLACLRLSVKLVEDGRDLSATARRLLVEEIREGVEQVGRRFAAVARQMSGSSGFGVTSSQFGAEVREIGPDVDTRTDDPAGNALREMTIAEELRAHPWYAFWRMAQRFGRSWDAAGPRLPAAGPPQVRDPRPGAQEEVRRLYHWLVPPEPGWTVPTAGIPQ